MSKTISYLGLKRRFLFAAILLLAAVIASVIGANLSAPSQKFDYLSDAVEIKEEALHVKWTGMDVRNSDLLSKRDKAQFAALIQRTDGFKNTPSQRPLIIGQAANVSAAPGCTGPDLTCTRSVHLNRTLTPNYIHGDLRLVSLLERSTRHDLQIDKTTGQIKFVHSLIQERQFRFILTQRGWVMKTNEIVSQTVLRQPNQLAQTTERFSGINYYPASAPWSKFWTDYPRKEIATDLDQIVGLGANSVRIFLNHAYFTDPATKSMALARLDDFMALCAQKNIKVIVTLFDLRSDYRFARWSEDSLHIGEVLTAIGKHEALLAIDLKNQPDLDFNAQGEPLVLAWLEAMSLSLKKHAPRVAVTIGWSDAEQAGNLANLVDLVSYHDYKNPNGFSQRFKSVQAIVDGKPIFVTEIGSSRWSLLKFGEGSSLAQAERLQEQLDQLSGANGVFVWTLHDFENVPTNIVGHRPWRRAQQKIFGIMDANGTPLPSGDVFQKFNSNFLSNPFLSTENSK